MPIKLRPWLLCSIKAFRTVSIFEEFWLHVAMERPVGEKFAVLNGRKQIQITVLIKVILYAMT